MGMIQTSQRELETFYAMALPGFLEYLAAHGTAVDRVEIATTTEGVTSLPARYRLGGVEKNVLVPLDLLTKDVDVQIAACGEAVAKALAAADNAAAAALRVETAVEDVDEVKQAALYAASEASRGASAADTSREACEAATVAATEAARLSMEETEKCRTATGECESVTASAREAMEAATTAAGEATASALRAENAAAACETATEKALDATTKAESATTAAMAAETAAREAIVDIRAVESSMTAVKAEFDAFFSESQGQLQDWETAEAARREAESDREAAEGLRGAAETARKAAEEERAAAETARQEATRAAIEAMSTATAMSRKLPYIEGGTWRVFNPETGAYEDSGVEATGRSPRIQNGTWWTYDDLTGEYVDSGQSVSADFLLTKEKIEGVFQGDITTHTHEHLRYAAQVYEEMPDLSTLTVWEDALGEHPFLAGNDIYVKDGTERSGYANYKLAKTASGLSWVRIPQVADGWKVVMVKQSNTDS